MNRGKKGSWEIQRHVIRKILKITDCNGHLVSFEQFSGKFCLKFLPLTLNALPNIMHSVRTFSVTRAFKAKGSLLLKSSKLWKIVFNKNIFENDRWGGCIPHIPPRSDPA